MNIKIATLALISTFAVGMTAIQAEAKGSGARFDFAPNIYRHEEANIPRRPQVIEPMHSVRSGAVPHGMSHLGIDPAMLAKKAPVVAPIVQQSVAASPSFARVVPTMAAPKPNFNQQFGKPLSLNPPVIAHAPMVPPPVGQMAAPKALAAAKPVAAHKPTIARATRSTKDVHGTIRARKAAPAGNGMLATAGKGVESYGKDFGYVPGAYLPSASTGSGFTSADVHGTLLHR